MREGCIAEILLDEAQLSAMRAGSSASVVVQDRRRQTVNVGTFSLRGFTAGMKALQEVNPAPTN